MRVVQIIDSLEAGGAERMAVKYKGISMLEMQELITHNFQEVFFKEL